MEPSILLAYLKANGHPVTDVAIGDSRDPRTWKLYFALGATVQEQTAAMAAVLAFNPNDPTVKDAAEGTAARAFAEQQFAKAASRFLFYKQNGGDALFDEAQADADRALWERCFKEAAS